MKKEKQTKSFVLSLVWWRGRQMTGIPINLTFFFHFSIFDYYYYYDDDDDDDFFSSLKFVPFHLSYLHRFFFFFSECHIPFASCPIRFCYFALTLSLG